MDAKAKSFTFLSNEGQVTVPFFQRPYVWEKDNWSDLLTDLLNSAKTHFLGSLILKQQRTPSGEPKEVTLIDGQQRLTTLSILLKALYDTFADGLKKNCEIPLRNHLFFKKDPTSSDYMVRIKHSQVDADAYNGVIRAGLDHGATTGVTAGTNRILECYKYFIDELGTNSESERRDLFKQLLDPEHKMLVVIDLTDEDDEQTIFDTTNTAGVRLTCADIIKNALFQRVIRLIGPLKAIELYKRTWHKVFLAELDTIGFWEAERLTGRLTRDNSEVLLHSIAVIKGFYDPDKHILSELSKLYKLQIDSFKSIEELEAFIEEIRAYGDIYREEIPSFDKTTAYAFENATQRLFHILDVLQITTFHPFILFVLKKYATNQCVRDQVLARLERFVVRRVLSAEETKSFNKMCRDFISDPDALLVALSETSDEKVLSGLKDMYSNKNAALVLFWLELHRRSKDNKYDTSELKYNYSLEHIMPQKWEEYWKQLPEKKKLDGKPMSDEEVKNDRYDKVYWLGNMTLLTSSLNSALRNYGFEKKMNGEGHKKGIKSYARLSITHDDIVSSFEGGDTVWDESKIEARTDRLGEEVLAIWGLGDCPIRLRRGKQFIGWIVKNYQPEGLVGNWLTCRTGAHAQIGRGRAHSARLIGSVVANYDPQGLSEITIGPRETAVHRKFQNKSHFSSLMSKINLPDEPLRLLGRKSNHE